MIISESTVGMQSTREYSARTSVTSSRNVSNVLVFSDNSGKTVGVKAVTDPSDVRSVNAKIRFSTLIYLWKQMFSKGGNGTIDKIMENLMGSTNYCLVTDFASYTYEESESTSFSFNGAVKTADGREIEFDVNVGMSRAYMEEYSVCASSLMEKVYLDPLVINLDCDTCDVRRQTFSFDLDCDGTADEIGRLGEGSGFLALDKNDNGVIDDGSELFGTKSGNGFYDLSFYDEDGNGWIDEADSIYSKLRIMCVDSDGKQHLYGLKESDVGAIFLGEVRTEFSLTDKANHERARITSSGMYLKESGGTGIMQNLDYVV